MSANVSRVLVTGGAGMIGRRVTQLLSSRGGEVAVVDNLSSGFPMPNTAARTIIGDIRNIDLLSQICRSFRPNAIVHLAAIHHIPTCEHQRAYSLDVNITGTENVLHAATQANVKRVIIASSGAVYGWEDRPLQEDQTPLWACDNYSIAKLSNESQLRFWSERTGNIGRVARIFNALANDDANAHLLPDIIAQLNARTGPCTIQLGNLTPRRDYIHADDIAAGLVAVLDDHRENIGFDVFNICSGVEQSVSQVVKAISDVLSVGISIELDTTRTRRVDRPSQLGCTKKAKHVLGWRAQIPFIDAIKKSVSLVGKQGQLECLTASRRP